jgi:hypothetical protein
MINLIKNTLSTDFFPTKNLNNDFSNPMYIKLEKLFEEISSEIESIIPSNKYDVVPHLGVGGIPFVPWIGVHAQHEGFDSSANYGFYITLLWKYYGRGLYLSFQKGTDGITGDDRAQQIETAVNLIRGKYGIGNFGTSIDLEYNKGRPKAYMRAHVFGKEFTPDNLHELPADLVKMEALYDGIVHDNPSVFIHSSGVSGTVFSSDSFKPTFDRETLERRADELLIKGDLQHLGGNTSPVSKLVESVQFERDPAVRAFVLSRANGICEFCKNNAPFVKENDQPFLEVHHIVPLAEGGADIVENAAALCPNCHREAHYGKLKDNIKFTLSSKS